MLMSVKRVFQDAASCATIQLEITSVLAWKGTHFWEMAVIVLVSMHVWNLIRPAILINYSRYASASNM